jgi:hypothetical protein
LGAPTPFTESTSDRSNLYALSDDPMNAAVKVGTTEDRCSLKNPHLPADKEISDGYRLASHRRWDPHWHHPADTIGGEELGGLPL